jgi:PKD repeat protein
MKTNFTNIILAMLCYAFCFACRKEQDIPLEVDFTLQVADNNYTVPVRILLYNKTSGAALFYKWTFTNANINEYNQKEPGEILVKQPGKVIIKLEAWNDEVRKEKVVELELDTVTVARFIATPRLNNIAPAEYDFTFTGQGATQFDWSFENAVTTASSERHPSGIRFNQPGSYKVFLAARNNRGIRDTLTQWITVRPPLMANFDVEPSFDDEDGEAPLVATLANHSISATQHQWYAAGGVITNPTDSIQPYVLIMPVLTQ